MIIIQGHLGTGLCTMHASCDSCGTFPSVSHAGNPSLIPFLVVCSIHTQDVKGLSSWITRQSSRVVPPRDEVLLTLKDVQYILDGARTLLLSYRAQCKHYNT